MLKHRKILPYIISLFVIVVAFSAGSIASAQEYEYSWGMTNWLSNNPSYYPGEIDKYGWNYTVHQPPRYNVPDQGLEFSSDTGILDPWYTPYNFNDAIDGIHCSRDAAGSCVYSQGWYLTDGSQRYVDHWGGYDNPGGNGSNGWNHYTVWMYYLYQRPKPTYTGISIGNYQYYNGAYWYKLGNQIQLNATANDLEGWVRTFRISILDSTNQGITGYFDFTNWFANCDGRNGGVFSGIDISPSSDSGHQWTREYYNANTCGEDWFGVYINVDNRCGARANSDYSTYGFDTGIRIGVDGTPPSQPSITLDSGKANGWLDGYITFNLSGSTDSGSGFDHYEYSIDGGAWQTYYGETGIYNEGWHSIQARAVDRVGNISAASTVYSGIDKTSPAITYTPNSCAWTNQDQPVSIHIHDDGCGIQSYKYRFSNDNGKTWGGWTSPSSNLPSGTKDAIIPVTVSSQYFDKVETYTVDYLGHDNTADSGIYYIDKSPPTGNVVFDYNDKTDYLHLTVNGVSDGIGSGVNNLYVVLKDLDDTSHTQQYNLTREDGSDTTWVLRSTDILTPFAESFQVSADVYAQDNVGNVSKLAATTFDLLNIWGEIAPNPGRQGQQITFTANTVGNPVKLEIAFPEGVSSHDKQSDSPVVNGKITIPITEQETAATRQLYTLPIDVPLTLDPHNNRLLTPYSFTVIATKKGGKSASVAMKLDVQNNIYTGLRTVFYK